MNVQIVHNEQSSVNWNCSKYCDKAGAHFLLSFKHSSTISGLVDLSMDSVHAQGFLYTWNGLCFDYFFLTSVQITYMQYEMQSAFGGLLLELHSCFTVVVIGMAFISKYVSANCKKVQWSQNGSKAIELRYENLSCSLHWTKLHCTEQ